MLSATQLRHLEICRVYKNETPRPTHPQLAVRFGVSERTVRSAIRFGERQRFFVDELSQKLDRELIEWREHLRWLESERDRHLKAARDENNKRQPLHPFALTALSREIREVRTRINELEGIYRQTLNVSVGADTGTTFKLELTGGDDGT